MTCLCCGLVAPVPVCAHFSCAGDHSAHCIQLRADAEASPQFPSLRERQCASPRISFFRPPRVSTARGSRARLSPLGSYESTFLRASYPCGIKNSPRVCQPLRVCRLWIDSTIKHLVHTLCQVVWGCLKGNFIVNESSSELRPPIHLVRSARMHFAYLVAESSLRRKTSWIPPFNSERSLGFSILETSLARLDHQFTW